MKRLTIVALLALAACGARATSRRGTLPEPAIDERIAAAPPDVSRLQGWSGPEITVSAPVRFAPTGDGPTLQALVLMRDVADDRELLLVIARLGGQVIASAPVARVRVGGASRRDVLAHAVHWPLGGGRSGLRVDVSVFELSPPRRFAVKTLLVDVSSGDLSVILDRLVESGDDARDRRATLAARDVDGDGLAELLVDERDSGARKRRLVYHRVAGGKYQTRDRSLFDE